VATWDELVEDARRAPSPHNTQPWLVEATDDTHALLLCRAERLLPVEDPDGRFLTCGMGIFAEALRVATEARGLALADEFLAPDLSAGATGEIAVARLSLSPGATEPRGRDALLRRRTSRLPYDGRPAAEAALAELAAVAAGFGHTARFSTDSAFVAWVLELNAATVFYDLAEDDRRAEIRHWTRTSETEAAQLADGFSPRCLGFPGQLLQLFFNHHRAIRPFEPLLKRLYLRQMRGTATVGWIAGPWATRDDWYRAGRMLLRLWLALTEHGLDLQPFGSVITNPTAHARLDERLGNETDEVWLLLRIGYGAEPPRSARLPLEAVLR
jgi:nitroreductase